MNYLDIKYPDIANGPGIRVSLFTAGCEYHCEGCFNPESWSFDNGELFTKDTEDKIINLLKLPFVKGITLLGGEPLHIRNRDEILNLVKRIRKEVPNKDIWTFSGNLFENFLKEEDIRIREILENIDVLVDGPFVISKKNLMLKFRGSENQRIINVKKSLETKTTVLINDTELS